MAASRSKTDPTAFTELNAILRELVEVSGAAFGTDCVGVYLIGSFAVGDADIHSDCDFLMVTAGRVNPAAEEELRRFHHRLPKRGGHWNKHLESRMHQSPT